MKLSAIAGSSFIIFRPPLLGMSKVRQWLNEKFVIPARSLSHSQIGLSLGVGLWGGIFPIPACSTFATVFLCSTVLVSLFNAAMTTITLSINFAVTPIQFMLIPVFLGRVGMPVSSAGELLDMIKGQSWGETISSFGKSFMYASLLWAVLAPVAIIMIQYIVVLSLKTLGSKQRHN